MLITELKTEPIERETTQQQSFKADVLSGLSSSPKTLSPKYFYDDKGSEIFQQITQHIDYYLSRTEYKILAQIKHELPQVIKEPVIDIIELGAGDGHKSDLILQGFLDVGCHVNFYPIDISSKALSLMKDNITPHNTLNIHGVVAEYSEGLSLIKQKSSNPQLLLFLGSNIGNFNPIERLNFLQNIRTQLDKPSYLLIGFDLKKDITILNTAYNDSAGLTRDFNLNLLERINRELGGNFSTSTFKHYGAYNPILGRMESYLISNENQEVTIQSLNKTFHFEIFEPLHLENSFKFLSGDINLLGTQSGFKIITHYSDEKNYFIDSLWQVSGLNKRGHFNLK